MTAIPEENGYQAELVAEARKAFSERGRLLGPMEMLELIEHFKGWIAEELSFEEGAAASLGRMLTDLDHAQFADQLPALLNGFERHACAYFVRRGSVPAFHAFCNAWREPMLRRILLMAEEGLELHELRRSPAPYAVLAAGVAGRREHTLEDSSRYFLVWSGEASDYFEQFAYRILAILVQCSLVGKSGGDFLSKAFWRGSLAHWSAWLAGEAGEGAEDSVRRLELLADLRHVGGDEKVAQQAIATCRASLAQANGTAVFEGAAKKAIALPLALSFPGRLRLEKGGEHAGSFNVVQLALRPLVAAVRVLALEHQLEPGPTCERVQALGALGVLDKAMVESLVQAYRHFTAMKIGREIALKPPYLNPADLTHTEIPGLVAGLQSVRALQKLLRARYGIGPVWRRW